MKRPFVVVLLYLVSAVLCGACASLTSKQENESPLRVIDVHTHADFSGKQEETSGILQTREQFVRELKEAGVVGAVSHSPQGGGSIDDSLKSEGVIHCFGVGAQVTPSKVEVGLKSGRYGCIKIYLGYVHRWAYDNEYRPLYRLAEKYDVPVVFHTGDPYSTKAKLKFTDPLTVDEVAVDFPKVRFVIAHCGNPWHASAAEVAFKNPNVYLECSAFLIGDLTKYSPEVIDRHVVQPISWIFSYVDDPTKIMFGTDWPLVGIKPYLEVYKRAIPKADWPAVFHDNAARVFKIKR